MIAKSVKRLVGEFADSRAFEMVLRRLERRTGHQQFLRVLTYHRVDVAGSRPECYPGLISTSRRGFARQMEFLARSYRVVSLDDVLRAVRGEAELPANAVQLTFDDATRDFAAHAWPVLKQWGLPVTLFVATAYPDNPSRHFWWDRLYRAVLQSADGTTISTPCGMFTLSDVRGRTSVFRRLKEYLKATPDAEFQEVLESITRCGGVSDPADNNVLGWDELRKLQREGVTLAPHTHTHPMLNQLPEKQLREEIMQSWEVLAKEIGTEISKALAYPAGGVNDAVVDVLRNLDFDLAFTTERGVNMNLDNRLRLKRINIGSQTTLGLLRLQLANWGK